MGFGWMIIGYFLTFLTSLLPNIFGYMIRIAGYAAMFYGSEKLSEYNVKFKLCLYPLVPLALVSLYGAVGEFFNIMLIDSAFFAQTFTKIAELFNAVLLLAFHMFLMLAIKSIADETGLTKISGKAVRNFVFFCAYALLFAVTQIPGVVTNEYLGFITGILMMLQLVWTILNIILLGSCYMRICPEGDEDMPQKKSRFKWVNDFRAELDRRENKAKESELEYRKDKARRKAEKKKDNSRKRK